MGIKDIKDYIKSKVSENESYTLRERINADDLLFKMKRFNIYKEFKPEGTEWVPSLTHKGQFEEKTAEEIMGDLKYEINAKMRRFDDKTLNNVMELIKDERAFAKQQIEENEDKGIAKYTIDACNKLSSIHRTILKERENTPEK